MHTGRGHFYYSHIPQSSKLTVTTQKRRPEPYIGRHSLKTLFHVKQCSKRRQNVRLCGEDGIENNTDKIQKIPYKPVVNAVLSSDHWCKKLYVRNRKILKEVKKLMKKIK